MTKCLEEKTQHSLHVDLKILKTILKSNKEKSKLKTTVAIIKRFKHNF